jgi:hypothetical protein
VHVHTGNSLIKVASVRFEIFTAVTMKNGLFWAVTPCGSCKNRRLGGTFCLHRQGEFLGIVRRLLVMANVAPSSPFLVTLIDGGAKFLRNVGSYKSHTT